MSGEKKWSVTRQGRAQCGIPNKRRMQFTESTRAFLSPFVFVVFFYFEMPARHSGPLRQLCVLARVILRARWFSASGCLLVYGHLGLVRRLRLTRSSASLFGKGEGENEAEREKKRVTSHVASERITNYPQNYFMPPVLVESKRQLLDDRLPTRTCPS